MSARRVHVRPETLGAPKTAAGVRDVGIPSHVIPYLTKYVAVLPVTGRDDLTFHDMRPSHIHALTLLPERI